MIYHPPDRHAASDGPVDRRRVEASVSALLIHGREKVSSSMYAHIRRNPRFAELVAKRTRFAGILAAIVLIVFYGFVLLVAFAPELIGKRLFEGSNLTFGILAGLLQFIFFWVLTLVYVRRANGEFDDINKELVKAAWKEEK
ncbi:Inner membrane protein YjcH [Thauera sp. GDN1]|nr:Inner membrane protein YjcH [Thauera sp. GDN1]